jgi:hypothetical protein
MANTATLFWRGALPSATANQATVPTGVQWVLTNLILTNYSTANQTVNVSVGGQPLISGVVLIPGATYALDCAQVLAAGDSIAAYAGAATSVSMHASGVAIT